MMDVFQNALNYVRYNNDNERQLFLWLLYMNGFLPNVAIIEANLASIGAGLWGVSGSSYYGANYFVFGLTQIVLVLFPE